VLLEEDVLERLVLEEDVAECCGWGLDGALLSGRGEVAEALLEDLSSLDLARRSDSSLRLIFFCPGEPVRSSCGGVAEVVSVSSWSPVGSIPGCDCGDDGCRRSSDS
jgi:hypothetical protein